jgi:uncharacterized membrane protein YbhN (UPF0104 family)
VTGLDGRLLDQRDTIRAVLDRKWWQAALLTAGRLGFDYGCLLAALCATGASPQPSMVLLAYLLFRHRYGRPVFRRTTDERKAGSPR